MHATSQYPENDDNPVHTLEIPSESNQFVYRSVQFHCDLGLSFVLDITSCLSIMRKSVFDLILPSEHTKYTDVRIHSVTHRRIPLLRETSSIVRLESDYISTRFPIFVGSPLIFTFEGPAYIGAKCNNPKGIQYSGRSGCSAAFDRTMLE
ncbi:unnamed protein product [Fasciola hepatica]|uniref:Uncharacterized protein n=1 Tax=Fasciola hepatica TaxID=6192 RepID=A0ABC9HHN6_FASHE